jgi:hypothetical protein
MGGTALAVLAEASIRLRYRSGIALLRYPPLQYYDERNPNDG